MAEIPDGLAYTAEHVWVEDEGGDTVRLGISDFAQDQLGDVVFLDLPAAGATMQQHEKMGEIESIKSVSDLFAPVSGEVLARNEEAVAKPESVNAAPYSDGWLLRVRLSDPDELGNLLTAEAYAALIAQPGDA